LSLLGFLACCVGIILTIAMGSLGGVLIYLQLTGQANCLDYPPVSLEKPTEGDTMEPVQEEG
jgi:hypothetical protein